MRAGPQRRALWWPTLIVAGVLCFVTFLAGGGLSLAHMTAVEMTLTLLAGAIVAGVVLFATRPPNGHGIWPVGLLVALSALTALSVVWSVQPDNSWQDAGRMFAYSGAFGASVTLGGVARARWPALMGGVILAAAVVCGYALLTKVFPDQLDAGDIYARLRAPYSYWNAIGLTAAMGAIGCLWLGARRSGHALLSALAYPLMGLMLITLMLAYSRGALIALLVGLTLWFCIVPLRLRGAAVLLTGAVGAAAAVAWAFSKHALSSDGVDLAARTSAGHQFGALLAMVLVGLTIAGLGIGFATSRRAPAIAGRRRAGALLLGILALSLVGFAGALAVSHRGLSGSISHGLHSLTDTHARVPNTPGRLTAVSSVRARYWNEALKVFRADPVLGAGAEGYGTARLRYRNETIDVRHAHGYIVQTLADLGAVGLALTIALLAAWMTAAARATNPFNRRLTGWRTPWRWRRSPTPYTPERIGMLSMLTLVVVFGIHSAVDWTWYVPGDACAALLCAGWLAGRGPLSAPADGASSPMSAPHSAVVPPGRMRGLAPRRTDPRSVAIACAAIIGALLAAWAQWQPQRSLDASQRALVLLASNPLGAQAAARDAVARDPLSAQALFTLSAVERASGHAAAAREALQRSVRLQPSNPETWIHLGEFDLSRIGASAIAGTRQSALSELAAGIYLNPQAIAPELIAKGNPDAIMIQNDYVQALRANTPTRARVIRARQRRHAPRPRVAPNTGR